MKIRPAILNSFFFIWSFGPFLVAARNIRDRRYHSVILLFSLVYGYSVYMYSGDVVRYAESFAMMRFAGWSDYWSMLVSVLTGNEAYLRHFGITAGQPDIYATSLQFFVSRLTDDVRWFFTAVSGVYAWLFLAFVRECVAEIPWNRTFPQKVFFAYLLLVIPFYVGVTGVRFWTALFLFMVFAIHYVRHHEVKFFLGAALSPLIHFSFALPVVLLLAYRIVGLSRVMTMALVFAGIGFFLVTSGQQTMTYVQESSTLAGDTIIAERMESYGDQDILGERLDRFSQTNWYVQVRAKLLVSILLILTLLELFGVLRWQNNGFTAKLYPFLILFFILTLFTFNLGSIGRFQNVFYLLALFRYAILSGINPASRQLRLISVLLAFVLVLHVLVTFRAGFYTVDPLLLVGNPLILYMYQSGQSLSELIVGH